MSNMLHYEQDYAMGYVHVDPESEYVYIEIVSEKAGLLVLFRTKKTAPLQDLMLQYCAQERVLMSDIRFELNDRLVKETDTPNSLHMQEGDSFDVYLRTDHFGPGQLMEFAMPNVVPGQFSFPVLWACLPLLHRKDKKLLPMDRINYASSNHGLLKPEWINLRVFGRNGNMIFKMKKTVKLNKLMEKYCERMVLLRSDVHFLFNGHRIAGSDTPDSMGMKERDNIKAVVRCPDGREGRVQRFSATTRKDHLKPEWIYLRVGRNANIIFRMKKTVKLTKLMKTYCERMELLRSSVSFLFRGEEIPGTATPDSLNMKDRDRIETVNSLSRLQPKNHMGSERIILNVFGEDGLLLKFKLKKTTNLAYLMDKHCEHQGLLRSTVLFMFNGQQIKDGNTPSSLRMKDQDRIDTRILKAPAA